MSNWKIKYYEDDNVYKVSRKEEIYDFIFREKEEAERFIKVFANELTPQI